MTGNSPARIHPARGRPRLTPDGMAPFNVSLDPDTAEGMRVLGEGNLSAGIRRAWEMLKSSLRRTL